MRILGVILAGGQGRRMGGADKALLPLAGKPLVEHVLNRLKPQVQQVLISANGGPERFQNFGAEVVGDAMPQGPLSGILAGLQRAGALGATHVVSCPVDTPFLPLDLVVRLSAAGDLAMARAADGDHPAIALWPVALAPALVAFLAAGEAKVTRFADAHGAARVAFPDPTAFQNLNTHEDLAAAEAILQGTT